MWDQPHLFDLMGRNRWFGANANVRVAMNLDERKVRMLLNMETTHCRQPPTTTNHRPTSHDANHATKRRWAWLCPSIRSGRRTAEPLPKYQVRFYIANHPTDDPSNRAAVLRLATY